MKNLILFSLAVIIVVSCDNKKSVKNDEGDTKKTPELLTVKADTDTIKQKENFHNDEVLSPARNQQMKETVNSDVMRLYKKLEKKSQGFNFINSHDTIITCAEGTKIRIPENTFVDEETGEKVAGKISLQVKEYYKISDILLTNLSTASDGKLLETGGMLYVEAFCNNRRCKIAPDKSIEIHFPCKKKSLEMELFNGKEKDRTINWVRNIVSKNITKQTVYTIVDHMPEFYGGENVMRKYIAKKIVYPKEAKENNIQGTVYVQFIINENGSVTNVQAIKSSNDILSNEAIRIVKNMPEWKPGKKAEKMVPVQMVIPIRFRLDGESGMYSETNTVPVNVGEKYPEKIILTDTTINSYGKTRDISAYVLYSSNLGWINCDRFRNNFQATDFVVEDKYQDNLDIKMVFHKYKSILCGQQSINGYSFKNVPLNEKVTIVAVKYEKDKNFIALQETVIGKEKFTNLEYKPASLDYLKEVVKKLDDLN